MHFYCNCGNRITDITDFLSYKASLLADQDEEDFFNEMETYIKNKTLSQEECLDGITLALPMYYMWRDVYQCPKCGRLFIDDGSEHLYSFVPEGEVNKKLLISVEGEDWKGFLWGEWQDEKPNWSDYHGYIEANVNVELPHQPFLFNNREELEKKFFELLEELKESERIRSAVLKVNGRWIYQWKRNSPEKEENNSSGCLKSLD